MKLFKITVFFLFLLITFYTKAIQPPVTQTTNSRIKQSGALRIIQSWEIQNFMRFLGCDINELWDDCIDSLSEKDKAEIYQINKGKYNSGVLRDKLVTPTSKLISKISKAFDKYIQTTKDFVEINNRNLDMFLENYKIRGYKNKPSQFLFLEMSTLTEDSIQKYVIKEQNPNNINLLRGIKKIVLYYFDINALSRRINLGDETIFDVPATPIAIQCYEDGSIEVYGFPEIPQDRIFTEHLESVENDQSSIKLKLLVFLLIGSELAAAYTTPFYLATIAAMRADSDKKAQQREKISQALKILGLDSAASMQAINKRYRQLSLKLHPDKPFGKATGFMEITWAYELLKSVM